MTYRARALLAILLSLACVCAKARAQPCEGQWVPGDGYAGVLGGVNAALNWDPDGNGPQPPLLVVAGQFTIAGNSRASNIAVWDGAEWSALGDPQMTTVNALAVLPDGRLVAGGAKNTFFDGRVLAAWNGAAWSTLGTAPTGDALAVNALAVMPNGDLVAGGKFTAMNGVQARNIARFDGTAWSAYGPGTDEMVLSLVVSPQGEIIAGGAFNTSGGVPTPRIARWNGAAWVSIGTGLNGYVRAMTFMPSGDLIVGGGFTQAGGNPALRIARWDGAAWTQVGGGMDNEVYGLARTPNGDILAGGLFTHADGLWANNIARWNGAAWSPLGSGVEPFGPIAALVLTPNGHVVVGGSFTTAQGRPASRVARWDGAAWSTLGLGNGGARFTIYDLGLLPGGEFAAGGRSLENNVGAMSSVARWSAGFFSPFAAGVNSAGGVEVLETFPNGNVVVAASNGIHLWNGVSWTNIAAGFDGPVWGMHVMPNGDLIAGGDFNTAGGVPAQSIARWNGSTWSAVAPSDPNGPVYISKIIDAPNGDLIVVAGFPPTTLVFPDIYVARWNGASWTRLGKRFSYSALNDIELLPDGSIIAVGGFRPADNSSDTSYVNAYFIARWDGTNWSQLGPTLTATSGNASINAIERLPNGDLVIAGQFNNAGSTVINNIARWNGAAWRPLGTGLTSTHPGNDLTARTLLQFPGGIAVGGNFIYAGGLVSPSFARYFFPTADFNHDGDVATDQDIEAFFACLGGHCCPTCGTADFNADGDTGTDQDIESFFRVLGGGSC